ncbi:MAG: methionine synthase [Alloprevotella sp.]|nr:methionine synthase [Alloprevotella sp.]
MLPSFHKILILDGAMGTMIQRYALGEADFRGEVFKDWPVRLQGNNDLIALTRPDVLRAIHRAYLEAGADIIETNTFNAQRISQADYHTEGHVGAINRAAAAIAREEADRMTALTPDKPRYVAGSVGPTNKTLSMSPDVDNPAFRALTFAELRDAYAEQMEALAEGGVDLFLVETIFDTLNAKAALMAAGMVAQKAGRDIPVMLSATVADASGRTLSGQTLDAFLASVAHAPHLLSVGLNCSFGAAAMRPYLRQLAAKAPCYISAHPNAGLPDEEGRYTETPAGMAAAVGRFIDEGLVNIVGGCCGSTPDHIRAIAARAEGRAPRPRPEAAAAAKVDWLAGLDAFSPLEGTFMNVGERCNVAGSRKFLRLVKEKQYDEALAIARKQVRDGAMLLDINMDDGLLDTAAEMTHFLQLMASDPEVARIPWMIDSSRFDVVEAALQCVQGKAVVNSISLKEGEAAFLDHARTIRRYGAAMVVMAFDEEGQATSYERKIAVCGRAYRLLTEQAQVPPADIIFDPNILTVATGMKEHDRYALDFIRATGWIRTHLPGAHVSGGVSNLSFAFRGHNYLREAMHAVFLYHAIAKGMDMGIVNPAAKVMYHDLPADLLEAIEDVVLCRRDDASERLMDFARQLAEARDQAAGEEAPAEDRSAIPLGQRLATALRTGDDEHLAEDLTEALAAYETPGAIIEGPLMQGMQLVGDLFGEGKMFLPQVVKSARTMKKAVAFLQPHLEALRQTAQASNGRYVVATVKGDVHDIGKNIVAVVLGCNNFEVIDLGVMTPAEIVVQAIRENDADFVALSGLITPSLDEMCHTARAMQQAGLHVPLFIGGATTSELHTALKIAPLYDGPVFHVKDAAQNPVLALQLKGAEGEALVAANRRRQAELVAAHEAARRPATAAAPAPVRRLELDWEREPRPVPSYLGCRTLPPVGIAEVRPLINWVYFFNLWRVRRGTPEAGAVQCEAEQLLDRLEAAGHTLAAQVAFYPANGTADALLFHLDGEDLRIPVPRQQEAEKPGDPQLSLCDFVAPAPLADHLGAFAVTLSPALVGELEAAKAEGDDYRSLLLQSVCDRLAEATAEWLHREVRRNLWGYAPGEDLPLADLARAAYRGIRPAVGYPALPDQQQIFRVARLLDFTKIGLQLTENGAMYPQSSVCGLLFSNPHSRYFAVKKELK